MSDWNGTPTCLGLARRSLRAADIQINRVWERPESRPIDAESMAEANEDKLIELHFYFVSIRNIYKYIAKIIEQDSALLPLKDEFEALNQQWLLHNSKGREAFEHIDQRLHGEKHEDRLVEVDGRAIHYGLRWEERTFVHSDMSWDISLETFQKLREKLSNFMDKLDDVHSI